VLLLGCCANTVDGARSAATALKILPTDDRITDAVGNGLSTSGFQPFVGGPEILPDGFRTDAEASPIACIGVTDTTMRVVYEATPMVEAARQSYFTLDQHVAATVSTLSATLHTHPGPNGPTSSYTRVLGDRADTIVEVSLAVPADGDHGPRAEAAAQAMLDKV
jgi:hypothetical protein